MYNVITIHRSAIIFVHEWYFPSSNNIKKTKKKKKSGHTHTHTYYNTHIWGIQKKNIEHKFNLLLFIISMCVDRAFLTFYRAKNI